ncbi:MULTISPECIES: DUF6124 family protein [Pseudomonas]|uniref:DUF3077 domain-containing protein n=1 Tax=Pseudomonas izuensis TaxID=2684212 RepID=A0ABM7RIN6_9PSED|nr:MULTISPECIES: DUF6124 family protein [Pseudomonas]RKS21205.1 hypothetical protein BJ917_3135 [Pseudomonas sp. WPR_5_2]BCX65999.1 hypothetical protein LAB08_R06060 [Pseudomonas izuensis]
MIKPTPNPPETDNVPVVRKPSTMFVIAPDIDTETLLAHACESLASASVMASDFATFLEGSQRSTLLGIAQVIMLGELAVNRALDNLDPP